MARQGFHAGTQDLLRDRLLDATFDLTCSDGWRAVTTGRIAERVGVSRSSVYNEIGPETALGEALIAREAERFLAGVLAQLRAHPEDPYRGIPAAAGYVLRTAGENPLVKAAVLGAHGADSELLPLLTKCRNPVVPALTRIEAEAATLYPHLDPERLTWVLEVAVRLTLSHLADPVGRVDYAVTQIRTLVVHTISNSIGGEERRKATQTHLPGHEDPVSPRHHVGRCLTRKITGSTRER